MKVGIIGFARSGKTTIFNSLTGAEAAVGAFGSREANVAVIKVPDARVDALAEIHQPKKITYAEFEFVDIAPSESTADTKALDTAALDVLKKADALVHVVRTFEDEGVVHPLDGVDPARDCVALEEELRFSDLVIIEKRIERMIKEARKDMEFELLCKCRDAIEKDISIRELELTPPEVALLQGYSFLSQKPLLVLGNYGEDALGQDDPSGMGEFATASGFTVIEFCGSMEMELNGLPEEEREAFREDLGLGDASRIRFIHAAYDMLGLMSFLTAGEPEVRAWTIQKDTKAVDSAAVIHSDIQRGFIRAEIVAFDDFTEAGSMTKAKEAGKVRLEGKEYIMQDGDIVLFRFNV